MATQQTVRGKGTLCQRSASAYGRVGAKRSWTVELKVKCYCHVISVTHISVGPDFTFSLRSHKICHKSQIIM